MGKNFDHTFKRPISVRMFKYFYAKTEKRQSLKNLGNNFFLLFYLNKLPHTNIYWNRGVNWKHLLILLVNIF